MTDSAIQSAKKLPWENLEAQMFLACICPDVSCHRQRYQNKLQKPRPTDTL